MKSARPSASANSQRQTSHTDRSSHALLYTAIALSMALVFIADIFTPLGITVWVLYIVPLTLSLWLPRPQMPLYVAALTSALVIFNFFSDTALLDPTIARTNRAMGVMTVWALAGIGYFFIRNRNMVWREEWLQRSQTNLGEIMLGEQPLDVLGSNILSFLTEHLGALAGAFYVQDGDHYRMVATYGVAKIGRAHV